MLSIGNLATRIFGSSNARRVKPYRPRVEQINVLESELIGLSDDALRARTADFRTQLANGAKLDDMLSPAFATVREAAKRTLGQRHFDVQMIGGMVLNDGRIAEMKTGEGKTLVATLPVYLNALAGEGVHVVTVNDYLASRDAEWMGQIYRFLGLSVGCIVHGLSQDQRRAAYAADITYGTNNELGFDYLRDNMEHSIDAMVQRGHQFAIVDEVDSILIDEARTPLIISGPVEDRSELYTTIDKFIPQLAASHFETDLKTRQVALTEEGNEFLEQVLKDAGLLKGETLYDVENVTIVHHVTNALKAHHLFQRDRDYIVRNSEVVLIDEFTGRMMPGRRFSDGLHQSLEAKEGANIQPENRTLASVTFQNYFRLYDKLAGMTGTASTEAAEFADIYGLEVIEVPTNVDVARVDEDDEVYRTEPEKYRAIIALIADCRMRGQPILVGTTSIEKSERLSGLLKDRKFLKELGTSLKDQAGRFKDGVDDELKAHLHAIGVFLDESAAPAKANQSKDDDGPFVHQVLNARYHEQEARIIAQAGVPGAVTIATNMAGRGTDIQLGGNLDMQIADWIATETEAGRTPDHAAIENTRKQLAAAIAEKKRRALEAGGLYVVGTERHESRRIDNQLRGRSGRQGDPGRSKFFLSLQDDLMKIFGSDRMDSVLSRLGLEENEAIMHPWINKALEKAQSKVEARNFDIRKNILKFDDVMNDQRKVIFEQRIDLMATEDVNETVEDMRHQVVGDLIAKHIPAKAYAEQWDVAGLRQEVQNVFDLDLPFEAWAAEEGIADEQIHDRLLKEVDTLAARKAADLGPETMRRVEKMVLLHTLDHLWREHLLMLEHLREVVGLRGYGQRDPLNEYKTESFTLFEDMLGRLRQATTGQLMHLQLSPQEAPPELEGPDFSEMEALHIDPFSGENEFELADARYAEDDGELRHAPLRTRKGSGNLNPKDPSTWGKVARNAPCPCGSGKKFKHCHGRLG